MARIEIIILGGVEYTVSAFNLDQMERATGAFEGAKGSVPYAFLRIALERANPKPKLNEIEPTIDEITNAFKKLAKLSGIELKENPTEPEAPAQN
jgi:hypothetical protein